MCNTVPNVIRKLGNETIEGFTRKELVSALIDDGYGPEKAQRRVLAALHSHQIIPQPDDESGTLFISPYCPFHWQRWPKELDENIIRPCRIDRYGKPEFIKG